MRWINPVDGSTVYPSEMNNHERRVFAEQIKAVLGLKRGG